MARAERSRGRCPVCSKDCAITEEGGVRHHFTDTPEQQAGPDSRKCRGVGQPPAGAKPAGGLRFLCRVPSGPEGCGHQVQLTANHRARSHLTPHSEPCAEGGSAFPIAVGPDGYRADTAEWTESNWEAALGRPEPETQELTPEQADAQGFHWPSGTPASRRVEDVDLPHDRQPDPHRHEADVAIAEAERVQREEDAAYAQSLRDGLEDSRRRIHDSVPLLDRGEDVFDPTHVIQDDRGMDLEVHPGEAGDCRLPGCCTHPGGFTYGDDGNGHSGSVCMICGAEELEPVQPPEPEKTIEELSRYTVGNLDRGEFFVRHTARPPLNRLVYRVQAVTDFCVQVTVVSAGAHAGRTGELTNLSEEITCTDLNGTPRPRQGSTPSGTPGAPRLPEPEPTPSRPARPTPVRSPAPSSTPPTTPAATPTTASKEAVSKKATSSGPTAKAATSTPSARKRTEPVTDAFSTSKQATAEADRYDRFGRYKLTHPATGKPVKWTRATTFAKSIADTYNLSMWSQRMVLKGASMRPDIVAAVSTLEVKADRDRVNGLVEDAKKAAGNKVAANLGTALHAFTEDRDKVLVGMPVKAKTVPENLLPSVDAYEALLQEFGLEPVPGLIEFTTAVMQYEIAGTSDRCYKVTRDITFKLHGRTVTLYAGEYVIGDVKSGADLSYGWMEICIQLAIYAQGLNTSGVFDWNQATWGHPAYLDKNGQEVRIQVRTDVGLIPHLPVDRKPGDPLATLFAVDLDWGWATAVLCGQVRSARKEGNLATALTVADVEEAPEPLQRAAARARSVISRPPTLEEKAQTVTTQAAASAVWKEAVAARTPKADVDRLIQIMKAKLESHVEQGA